MPLARSLTKKLQKLRSRANSEATSPLSPPTGATSTSSSGGPGAGATDYFYSISFDQTQSATISPTSSQASLSTAGSPMSPDTPSGDLTVHAQRIYASSSANLQRVTDTLPTTVPTTLSQSQKDLTSTVAAKLQQYPGDNSTGPVGSGVPSRSASQKSTKSQASSVYSHSVNQQQQQQQQQPQVQAPESVELFISNADGSIEPVHYKEEIVEDPIEARADEMAMNILEKVSADDYVREIKAGSWYIS
uniref:ARAD1D05478p n=1 Tax=Blastobotrys adeninivorans TaxID=409370 RepID=A0A060T8C8_BLAAD